MIVFVPGTLPECEKAHPTAKSSLLTVEFFKNLFRNTEIARDAGKTGKSQC
jgi:hypothetical protein